MIKLTHQERQSTVWLKIKAGYEARLEELRAKNDASLTESDTARLRGKIAEAKFLISLDDDNAPVQAQGFEDF